MRTTSFVSVKGRVQEPEPWIAKQLHSILTQPVYRGLIRHKDQHLDGEHAAIIDLELWEEVQNKLRENAPEFRKMDGNDNGIATGKTRLPHPLKGLVHSNDGYALTPTYANKSGKKSDGTKSRKRYRYYVCVTLSPPVAGKREFGTHRKAPELWELYSQRVN